MMKYMQWIGALTGKRLQAVGKIRLYGFGDIRHIEILNIVFLLANRA